MKQLKENFEEKESALDKLINWVADTQPEELKEYIDMLRQQNKGISNDDLAKKIKNRKAFKNGLVGAITGVGGLITLPLAIPADLIASWKIQAFMAFAIAYVYGQTASSTDLKTDLYIIIAGDSAKEALKRFGIEAGKIVTKKMIQKYITIDIMKGIWRVLSRKIITKAGTKSLTSFTKMIPGVGAVIGFAFDYASAQTVGKYAIQYYSGKK